MRFHLLLLLFAIMSDSIAQNDFLNNQKRYPRVRTAISEKEAQITKLLETKEISLSTLNILICAYKQEQQLALYAKNKDDENYKKIQTYSICAKSGNLGPKRKQGDYQVPEGFYHIDRFNPASNFFLSLGINYPNQSDKLKSSFPDLGGDIFIHGSCVTIGCLPMTDEKIKEIYVYAIHSMNNGQTEIPVYVFPFKMSEANLSKNSNEKFDMFWENLKQGYDRFQESKEELSIRFNNQGDYLF